jgi:hypothetical protein
MEVFIKPREGLIVRHPVTKEILSVDGATVILSGGEGKYWRRRITCGDVIITNNKIEEEEE